MIGGVALWVAISLVGIAALPAYGLIAGTILAGIILKDKKAEKAVY